MATIDALDIQISVSVNRSIAAIQRLNSQLGSLNTGLRSIGLSANTNLKKISEVSQKLEKNFSSVNKISQNLTNNLKKVTGQILTIRGVWKSIENSMNYIETLNYFERAFEQVAEKADLSHFSKLGYESAEEYFNSFSERAKELTSKMSGFNINIDGTLTASGLPSLGINPNQMMNYQAMFGQMASSMGVASETSLKLSNALTMIGADLASVKNMDFSKTWQDMASGLSGMSRTLDKYGVNIRNVNLQQKLNELGIQASITALNQNDKALLRGIILLDSTRYAWGDLALTLNQPANQLRLIQGNLQNLSRTIGNLFLPVVAKVLPYINAFTIALQRLFTWIAKIFRIDISGLLPKGGGYSSEFDSLIDGAEDLEDSIDGATKSLKKLKTTTLGIDELNINAPDESSGTSGTGIGGLGAGLLDAEFDKAYEEYLKAWNEAFSGIEDRANETADKIQGFFQNLFKPISTAWSTEGIHVMGSWEKALGEIGKLAKDIGNDFMTIWQQEETADIFKDIFHTVEDIGFVAGNLASNFREAWNTNEVGLHIFENIRNILGVIVKNIRKAADYTVQWSKTLDFYPILSSIEQWTKSLIPVFDALSGMVSDFYTQVLLPLGKWTLEKGLPDLLDIATDLNTSIDWTRIRKSLQGLNVELVKIGKFTFTGAIDFVGKFLSPIAKWTMNKALPTLVDTVTNFSSKIKWTVLNDNLRRFWEGLSKFTTGIGNGMILFFQSVSPFLTSTLAALINGIGAALGALGDALNKIPAEVAQALGGAIAGILSVFAAHQAISGIITGISAAMQGLSGALAVLAANPLTALAAGIGGLAAALITLEESWIKEENNLWETKQIEQYGATLDQIKDKYRELRESIALNSQARIDHVNNVSGVEAQYLDTIAQKYLNLSEKTDLSAAEYAELKLAAQELVNNFPQLEQYYNDATGLIDVERSAIEDLITAKKAELTLNAISDEWSAAIRDQVEAQKALDEASKNLNDALSEQKEKLKPIEDALRDNSNANVSEFQPAYAEATAKVETFTTAMEEAQKALDKVSGELSYYEGAYSTAMEQLETNAGDYGKTVATNFTDTLTTELDNAQPTVQTAVDNLLNEENITVDTAPIGQNAVGGITTTIEESDFVTPITTKMNEMSEAAQEALGGVPSTVFEEIGNSTMQGLEKGIDELKDSPVSKLKLVSLNMTKVFDGIKTTFENIGKSVMQGLLDGLESMESSLYSKAQSIADNIANTVKTALDIHSPSRVMFELGGFTMQGFQNGLESLYQPILQSVKNFGMDLQLAPVADVGISYQDYKYAFAAPYTENSNYNDSNYDGNIKSMLREAVHEEVSYLVQTLAPYLGDISQSAREAAAKDLSFNLDGREFINAVDEANQRMGFNFSTGQSRGGFAF